MGISSLFGLIFVFSLFFFFFPFKRGFDFDLSCFLGLYGPVISGYRMRILNVIRVSVLFIVNCNFECNWESGCLGL